MWKCTKQRNLFVKNCVALNAALIRLYKKRIIFNVKVQNYLSYRTINVPINLFAT